MGLFSKIANIISPQKRMEQRLENTLLNTRFDLTQDVDVLIGNLREFRFNGQYNEKEIEYISKRLNQKMNLIRESYSNGEFDYVALELLKTKRRFERDSLRTSPEERLQLSYVR